LLPRHEWFTVLLVREVHQRLVHVGVAHTLREEYWILQGRAQIRSIISKCVICQKYEGSLFQLPNMPPWPRERVSQLEPFQFIGLDYLGPIHVNLETELKKVCICLFTCLAVRAVHLEWILDLTATQFLNCLRRFVSHWGKPDLTMRHNSSYLVQH